MKFMNKTCLILSFPILFIGLTQCHAEIILRFQSEVNSNATHLGDILHIENDEQHWANLPLQSYPTAGEIISKETLITWLTKRLGQISFTWQGKTHIRVNRTVRTTKQALIAKAKTTLIQQLKRFHYTHFKVEPLTDIRDSEHAIDDIEAKTSLHFPTAKRVCVWLTPKHSKSSRIAIWFNIHAYSKTLVSKHRLPRNTLLTLRDFSMQERDIAGLTGKPARSISKHSWLTSSIDSHTILLTKHLKKPPLITKGQTIKVTVHHRHITLTTEAVALGEGYLDQSILVKNPLTQKTFFARITGLQQAEIAS